MRGLEVRLELVNGVDLAETRLDQLEEGLISVVARYLLYDYSPVFHMGVVVRELSSFFELLTEKIPTHETVLFGQDPQVGAFVRDSELAVQLYPFGGSPLAAGLLGVDIDIVDPSEVPEIRLEARVVDCWWQTCDIDFEPWLFLGGLLCKISLFHVGGDVVIIGYYKD